MMRSTCWGSGSARWVALVFVLILSGSVMAGMAAYSGDTTGGPTWHRPQETTFLSTIGTAVPYETRAFTVSSPGVYHVTSA